MEAYVELERLLEQVRIERREKEACHQALHDAQRSLDEQRKHTMAAEEALQAHLETMLLGRSPAA